MVKLMYEELAGQGYKGGYGRLAAYARRWRQNRGSQGGMPNLPHSCHNCASLDKPFYWRCARLVPLTTRSHGKLKNVGPPCHRGPDTDTLTSSQTCWKAVAMLISLRKFLSLFALALLLTACGGGGDDSPDLLEIEASVGGRPVAGFVALPGTRTALFVPVGLSFDLYASEPVTWSVFIGGVFIPGTGNTFTLTGTSVREAMVTNAQYSASTFGFAPGPTPFQVTIVATSLLDPGQVATVDVLVTN